MLDDADTFVNQMTLKKFRHVSIFSWQKLVTTLDDRQLHAESAECLREFATDRADEMSALLGTQPKFRQSPPIKFRSTRATRPPNAAVPAAATNPAVPAPMTMTL